MYFVVVGMVVLDGGRPASLHGFGGFRIVSLRFVSFRFVAFHFVSLCLARRAKPPEYPRTVRYDSTFKLRGRSE